jgi:hypothetical protein
MHHVRVEMPASGTFYCRVGKTFPYKQRLHLPKFQGPQHAPQSRHSTAVALSSIENLAYQLLLPPVDGLAP